jgi:hypothetical protein
VEDEVKLAFTFVPDDDNAFACDDEGFEQTHGNHLTAICNLIDEHGTNKYDLRKSVVKEITFLGADGEKPLAPLFLTIFLGCRPEGRLSSEMAGLKGRYPLQIAGEHPVIHSGVEEHGEDAELLRTQYGNISDELISDILQDTVVETNGVILPKILLQTVNSCFTDGDGTQAMSRWKRDANQSGFFTLTREEYEAVSSKVSKVLRLTRESFQDASTILAVLSVGPNETLPIKEVLRNKPYYVYVKMTFRSDFV